MSEPKTYTLTLPTVAVGDTTSVDIRAYTDKLASQISTMVEFLLAACDQANEHFGADLDKRAVDIWTDQLTRENMLEPLTLAAEDREREEAEARPVRRAPLPGRLL